MRTAPRLLALSLFGLAALSPALAQDSTPDYEAELRQERADKDERFRTGDDSPIPPAGRAAFDRLSYFPIDPAYRVEATLERTENAIPFDLPHTNGQARRYVSFGVVTFELGGERHRLEAVRLAEPTEDDTTVAILFHDATNGSENPREATYGGGRYLDVPLPDADATTLTLDFNRAYHPYCVYNGQYICPLPPPTNRLRFAVKAGEKLPLPEADLPDGWRYFTPQEGGFRIGLPETPTRTSSKNQNGAVLTNYLVDKGPYGYLVNVTELAAASTPEEQTQYFETMKIVLPNSLKGTLTSSSTLEIEGYPAADFVIDIPGGSARFVVILIGARIVQLAMFNDSDERATLDEAFIGSFQVLDTTAKPRLQRLLDETGLAYDFLDGAYRLTLFFESDADSALAASLGPDDGGDRSHLVFVTESYDELTETSYYAAFGMVYVGPTQPDAAFLRDALMTASEEELGGFKLTQNVDDDGGTLWRLYYLRAIPSTDDAESLADALWHTAYRADELESNWVPGDEW